MERVRRRVPFCEIRSREIARERQHALVEEGGRVEGLREGATECGERKHRRSWRISSASERLNFRFSTPLSIVAAIDES